MAEAADNDVPILSRLRAPEGAVRKKKRKGRGPGSRWGKTAGKGQKGQKARHPGNFSHVGFEGGQWPLQLRLPKIGFRNKFKKQVAVVNVNDLSRYDAGATVDPGALLEAGLVNGAHDSIKILGEGELEKALTVRAHAFSKSAKEKIEKAGGTVEVIEGTPSKSE
jgi:large subunit ribosomal protein L15